MTLFIRNLPVVLGMIQAIACASVYGSDWPHWRGPDRNGVSSEKGWLDQWPANGPTIAWRAKVGLGFSSIVVANNRAATAGHADGKDTVFCFDAATGKELWKHSYAAELGDKYYEGGTTGTPTFEGDRLYWLSRWGDLFCFEAGTGKIAWSKNIQKETALRIPTWGFTGAPLVQDNLLILNMGESGVAVEKASGKLVWKSADKDPGYSTPLPVKRNGEPVIVMASSQSYLAVKPKTGEEIWRYRWLTEYDVNAADPIINGDQVFISTGYGKGATLINLGTGEPQQVWKNKSLRTQLNAAVLHEGHLYGTDGDTVESASLKCIEFSTGNVKWTHPNFKSGAVIIADGKMIALSGSGELMIAPATSAGFKPTARTQVLGGKTWTAPVLANGLIYCRNGRGDIAVVNVKK